MERRLFGSNCDFLIQVQLQNKKTTVKSQVTSPINIKSYNTVIVQLTEFTELTELTELTEFTEFTEFKELTEFTIVYRDPVYLIS